MTLESDRCLTHKPTLDDLCTAMAKFLNCLERADLDTLADLYNRVTVEPGKASALAPIIMGEIARRARRRSGKGREASFVERRKDLLMARNINNRQKLRVAPPNPVARTFPRFKPQIVRSRVRYTRKGRKANWS
jgi:hypothetical protein